jgi:hypothetical protein
MQIKIPLKTFYQRCLNDYKFGDRSHYLDAIKKSKNKYCFNPFISTECDIQIKLGGLIEDYFLSSKLPFSVNAEMKIYDSPYKNERADLTIHEVYTDTLYSAIDSHKKTLKCAVEVKFANAVHPNYEFKRNLIIPDLNKLSSLPDNVEKVYVFLDEANGLATTNADFLIKECDERKIFLFTNNKYINYNLNYPYGHNHMFWLSKNKSLNDKEYVFDKRDKFLQTMTDCFQIVARDEETAEVNIQDKKIVIYYASEFDKSKDEIEGHIFLDTFSDKPLTEQEIKQFFGSFAARTNSYLFEVIGESETLII